MNSTPDVAPLTLTATLHLTFCPACGIAFAFPEALRVHHAHERVPVFCPNGHAHAIDADPAEEAAALLVALAEVATLRARCTNLQERVAILDTAPAGPVSDDEVRRRCHMLANRAETVEGPGGFGRRMCRFCGKARKGSTMFRHLWEAHQEQVRMMGRGAFE